MSADALVTVERDRQVGVALLNRPKQLNALSTPLMLELAAALRELDRDDAIRAIVLGGNDRAFAAGADIRELLDGGNDPSDPPGAGAWDELRRIAKPIVAAVSGHCLGGGCELAMACDLIVASDTARFGLPEASLGLIPGAGGTQRLVRAVGKAVAMDMVLSGRTLSAREALQFGLVARVVAKEAWLDEARRVAGAIAARGPVAVRLAKAAINQAYEGPLAAGIEREREAFAIVRGTADAAEGLAAFLEKREPRFEGR